MDIQTLQQQLVDQAGEQRYPPVDQWDPPFCGDMELVIKTSGQWWHSGTPFTRAPLVKLFASVIKKENDKYFLVTPVEKIGIQVEDVPFVIIDATRIDGAYHLTTQSGDHFILNDAHPIELRDFQGNKVPYVKVRRNLWGRIHQNVLYRWLDEAQQEMKDKHLQLYISSQDQRFLIGEMRVDGV